MRQAANDIFTTKNFLLLIIAGDVAIDAHAAVVEITSIVEEFARRAPGSLNPLGGTLLVVVSDEQKRMLARYGGITCLDATYKINKWGLAFFMVAIIDEHRNAFPCAYIIVQHEKAESVAEALAYLKHLVPAWKPTTVITDKDDAEINAVKAIFPDATLVLCEFHAKQAWLRWLRTSAHGVPKLEQKRIYDLLCDMMKSPSAQVACTKVWPIHVYMHVKLLL